MTESGAMEQAGIRRRRTPLMWIIKSVVLPFRFAWLLIVWFRLRRQARKFAG